ncbi:SdiA-regulated family protein [Terrimonas sp. NA20]|uniref:SdiA-regulated family protein n=1 Tax=Terrimonas ginsenosidimutans TaxID=2908004 RepID=A0ABS9KYI9_9BACT|nr:SdiA-regulated family protein [Terrimonas ginsenosidimutans]MCG2617444.1 SdiA-regulated family protein [Terrimonas ginsenosidimutans]
MIRRFKSLFVAAALILLINSCSSEESEGKTPKEYNLNKPERFAMPESLLEISGIAFNKGIADTIYAIQDEEGKLFRLAWGNKKQFHGKFWKSGDYEDVSILRDKVIILKSNGSLFSFPFTDAIYDEIDSVKEYQKLLPEGEYEGMYGDEISGKLYLLCKNCTIDNNDNVTGYIYRADSDSLVFAGQFNIDVDPIKPFSGKVKKGLRPSAIAKNPVTREWFIVSAVHNLLVITDENWKVKVAYPLNGNTFNQPEGIAFDSAGNLYISNEGDDISAGNILKFQRLTP